ncbi:hypothetical protein [Streptomyces sp. NPDC101150]|uniref:hypothetical protein n=1 Tax=Streptomyces sp. NPDC101150 TaxID=3366114 RepID=UPI0037F8A583
MGHDRQLRYRDQRKLRGLWLADDSGVARTLDRQGPDAPAVGRAGFDAALSGRRGGVKSALMDQSVLAGLGNLLADEVPWRAGLHLARWVGGLSEDERGRLYADIRRASWLTLSPRPAGRDVPAAVATLRREEGASGSRGTTGPVIAPKYPPRQTAARASAAA